MKREDVAHLATLARIQLSEDELTTLQGELSSIVSYVSTVTDIAGDAADTAPSLGARHNVFRSDVVTNEPDEYTEVLLAELPHKEGRYMKVKKILGGTE
jgi:aspartyl-tRNA(Asn)/glutamyl-tRNA(Gln) amidotransferase subunit C